MKDEKGRPMTYWGGESFDRTASHMAGENVSHQEPVAWIDFIEESNVYDLNVGGRGTPLYFKHKPQVVRAPTYRTLTDEEIRSCIVEIDTNKPDMFINFARAILKKAQEK